MLVERAEACTASDAAFDRTLAPLERLIEPTLNAPVVTAHGEVIGSLHAVLLLGTPLPPGRCAALAGGAGEAALQQALDEEVEGMWRGDGLSRQAAAAKRAFINRLANDKGLLCEAS